MIKRLCDNKNLLSSSEVAKTNTQVLLNLNLNPRDLNNKIEKQSKLTINN